MFSTDADKLNFLLETEAELSELGAHDGLMARARDEERPKYITNYIGSKQKLVDWIWKATPETAKSVVDAFSGSSVVGYMYKSKGLAVHSNDRLRYCFHIARAIVENDSVTLSDEEIESLLDRSRRREGLCAQAIRRALFRAGCPQADRHRAFERRQALRLQKGHRAVCPGQNLHHR